MPKTKISEFSSTPANNTDIDSINISEGCAPSGINDAIRELMSQLKDWQAGTSNDPMVIGSSGSLTLNQGTANGVAYLNGSKVVTSGSALTFDGNVLALSQAGATGFTLTSTASQSYINLRSVATSGFESFIGFGDASAGNIGQMIGINGGGLRWTTGGSEQMRLTSTGLGIGTSSPSYKLQVGDGSADTRGLFLSNNNFSIGVGRTTGTIGGYIGSPSSDVMVFSGNGGAEKMRIDSSGNLGIGTSSPATKLQVYGGALTVGNESTYAARFGNNSNKGVTIGYDTTNNVGHIGSINPAVAWTDLVINANGGNLGLGVTPSAWASGFKAFQVAANAAVWGGTVSGSGPTYLTNNVFFDGARKYIGTGAAAEYQQNAGVHSWYTAPSGTAGNAITFTQAMTLNASGQRMLGTTTPWGVETISKTVDNSSAVATNISAFGGSVSILHNQDNGASGNKNGLFFAHAGSPGVMSGVASTKFAGGWRTTLDFYVNNITGVDTGDIQLAGRFDPDGNLLVGKTTSSIAVAGTELRQTLAPIFTFNGECLFINRITTDGTLIDFRQDNVTEGTISVSGTTVSYNGGHLSRWAQTTTAKDESLVKGTVLSNLDAMNVYTDAEGNPVQNEQLNKVKVSDVEGDVNVAGVFVNWAHDEQHNVDEINMAMTGDMIIRIAQGTTVQRGDLLMSADDGTAKPQGDDIVRSKTIAKVTSNHVTCTYADGSYCVPCVLMAC